MCESDESGASWGDGVRIRIVEREPGDGRSQRRHAAQPIRHFDEQAAGIVLVLNALSECVGEGLDPAVAIAHV